MQNDCKAIIDRVADQAFAAKCASDNIAFFFDKGHNFDAMVVWIMIFDECPNAFNPSHNAQATVKYPAARYRIDM